MLINLRALTPLFSSVEEDFQTLASNFKVAFWKIGQSVLEKSRKGTIFDDEMKMHESDAEEDNFDAVQDTAEKLIGFPPTPCSQ